MPKDSLSRSFPESAERILWAHPVYQYAEYGYDLTGIKLQFKNGDRLCGLRITEAGFGCFIVGTDPSTWIVEPDWMEDIDFAKFRSALDRLLKFLEENG